MILIIFGFVFLILALVCAFSFGHSDFDDRGWLAPLLISFIGGVMFVMVGSALTAQPPEIIKCRNYRIDTELNINYLNNVEVSRDSIYVLHIQDYITNKTKN